jgi:hypothetical protein
VFRDVFKWKHVDAGEGWLIFALPPAELGVHPAEGPTFDAGTRHQITFFCDDLGPTIRDLRSKGIDVRGEPKDEGWGITTMLGLPGGVEVMLYQPKHPVAVHASGAPAGARKRAATARKRRPARRPATRKARPAARAAKRRARR